MSDPSNSDLELVEVLEFEDEDPDTVKYEKVVVSDDSVSDDDESLEIVLRKVNARTPAHEVSAPRQSVQRILTPQHRPVPIVTKPKVSGSAERARKRRPQTDPAGGRFAERFHGLDSEGAESGGVGKP
jgi:hypothetical protein